MSNILVTVDDQNLHVTDGPKVAAQGVKENYLVFTFSKEWDGFGKTALFYREEDEKTVYESAVDAEGKALVPHEVTAKDGRMCFGVCGVKDDIILTSEILKYRIVKGRYTSGSESEPPTPGIYEQMLTIAGQMQGTYNSLKIELENKIGDEAAARTTNDGNLNTQIAAERARIDNLLANNQGVGMVETTLFEGDARYKETTYTLSESVTGFEYLDFYLETIATGKREIHTVPVIEGTTYVLDFVNIADYTQSNNSTELIQIGEISVSFTGTTLTVVNHTYLDYYPTDGGVTSSGIVTASTAQVIRDMAGRIYKIVGRKMGDNTELTDIRVGYDGTTYESAGAAVREQFGDLKDDLLIKNKNNQSNIGKGYELLNPKDPDFLIKYGFSGSTGNIVESEVSFITNFIPVSFGDLISAYYHGESVFTNPSGVMKIALYDKNKAWKKTINFTNLPFDSEFVDLDHVGFFRLQLYRGGGRSIYGYQIHNLSYGLFENLDYKYPYGIDGDFEHYVIVDSDFTVGSDTEVANSRRAKQIINDLSYGSIIKFDKTQVGATYHVLDKVTGQILYAFSGWDHTGEIIVNTKGFSNYKVAVILSAVDPSEYLDVNTVHRYVTIFNRKKVCDLFMFMGQSNMAGRGITNNTWSEDAPDVLIGAGLEFRAISDPTRFYPIAKNMGINENVTGAIDDGSLKTGSMIPAFVNTYYKYTNIPIIAVSASEGGTKISQWQPETAKLNDAITRLNTAVSFLEENGYEIRHKYMAWCQGETDGHYKTSVADYKTGFLAMFAEMRAAGIEKCFLFRIGEFNGDESQDYSDIIRAQTEICQNESDVIMVTANQVTFKDRGLMKDTAHYYQMAYNEMGEYGGINAAIYVNTAKEPTMYDPKYDNLYFCHKN